MLGVAEMEATKMGVTETGVAEMVRAARMVRVAEKTEAVERIEVATAVGAGEVFD